MFGTNRLFYAIVCVIALNTTALFALDAALPDYEERIEIAQMLEKVRRGIQEQDVELIFDQLCVDSTSFARIRDEITTLSEEEFSKDSTYILRSPYLNYFREKERDINGLFARLSDQGIQKPESSFSDSWFIELEQKKLRISDNKKDATLDLLVGSDLIATDSTYIMQLSPEELSSLSKADREKLLHFHPVSLKLVKIRNRWRINSLNTFFHMVNDRMVSDVKK